MKKENQDEFLKAVMEIGELWAPVQKKKRVCYNKIDDPKMIARAYDPCISCSAHLVEIKHHFTLPFLKIL